MAWAITTAVVALLVAVVPLVFQLAPQWKPDPREKVSAAINVFAVEPNVRLGDWLERRYPGDKDARERILGHKEVQEGELDFPGEVIYVQMEVSGSKGRAVRLRARVYGRRSQRPIDLPEDVFTQRSSNIRIDAPSRSSVQLLFIPDLSVETTCQFVRVELFNDDGVLAVADSPVLRHGKPVTSRERTACDK